MKRVHSNFIESKYANFTKDGTTYKIHKEYQNIKQNKKRLSEEKLNSRMTDSRSL